MLLSSITDVLCKKKCPTGADSSAGIDPQYVFTELEQKRKDLFNILGCNSPSRVFEDGWDGRRSWSRLSFVRVAS